MRFPAPAVPCFLGLLCSAVWADTAAPISEVVLYPGGASIIRSVKLAAGNDVIVIPRLPSAFDAKTLRIEGGPGIRIVQTVVKDAARTEAFSPQEAELDAKIQALQDQQAALDAEARAATLVSEYLGRVGGIAVNAGQQTAPDAKSIAAQAEAIGKAGSEALGRIQRLEVQKRELDKKIKALQANLAKLKTGDRNTRELSISVSADKAGSLRLSYQIRNAGWAPSYRAELLSASGKVELERQAIVSQKTGEDWSNVRLRLSTSQPQASPNAPTPQPWLLYYAPPTPKLGGAMSVAMEAAPAPAPAMAQRFRETEDSYSAPTFQVESSFATEFEVPGRASIASDGRETVIPLASYAIPVRQKIRITPRSSAQAFVIAQAERPAGVWPAGRMQLFRDGNFVGASDWRLSDQAGLSLSFGRDELVRVENTPVKQDSGSAGVFDTKAQRRIANVFSISNAHTGAVDIEVLEASPVAAADEIKVKTSFMPPVSSDSWNKQRGIVAWEKSLQANETAKFSVDYMIEYPKDGHVPALGRNY